MLKFYKNIISDTTADIIYSKFMSLVVNENGSLNEELFEGSNEATNKKSFGLFGLQETYLEIDKINDLVLKDFGNEYKFTHSYIRVYPDGGILNPHVDRDGLDLTLTVNVHSNPNNPWPILFSKKSLDFSEYGPECYIGNQESYTLLKDFLGDYVSIVTNKGDGACCTRNIPHWREPFKASFTGEHYVQIFYHWIKN